MSKAGDALRLAAIDEEDLAVVSAHVQDAVLKVGDMVYLPKERRFAVAMNRFVWEKAADGSRRDCERRRSVLILDRVLSARTSHIDRSRRDEVLELLAVEVIEARLADLGKSWVTNARPSHDLAEGEVKPGA